MSLNPSTCTNKREEFLHSLMAKYNIHEKKTWQNNNKTLAQNAYVIDVKNMDWVAEIFSKFFDYNQKHPHERPIVAVPVAGWDEKNAHCIPGASTEGRHDQLVEEYAKSFSLSPFTTAVNADVILRIPKELQEMKIIKLENKRYLKVTSGVRITDAEKYLEAKKLALPPNFPTLHVASVAGTTANGCYGPCKDLPSMTTNIVEMEVITPTGEQLTLSEKENSQLFSVLRAI